MHVVSPGTVEPAQFGQTLLCHVNGWVAGVFRAATLNEDGQPSGSRERLTEGIGRTYSQLRGDREHPMRLSGW